MEHHFESLNLELWLFLFHILYRTFNFLIKDGWNVKMGLGCRLPMVWQSHVGKENNSLWNAYRGKNRWEISPLALFVISNPKNAIQPLQYPGNFGTWGLVFAGDSAPRLWSLWNPCPAFWSATGKYEWIFDDCPDKRLHPREHRARETQSLLSSGLQALD